MSLKSRLSNLQAQAGVSPALTALAPDEPVEPRADLVERLGRLHSKRIQARMQVQSVAMPIEVLAENVGGEVIADGLIRIDETLSLDERCGQVALDQLRLPYRLPIETENDCRRVYIDTETTGLSGGSGTLAFLVGVAVVTDSAIELTQLLMTQFGAESVMLESLKALFTADDQLVSYNGKSFDLPLLITRFRMQGIEQPFEQLPHLDLVHPMRRLFSQQWPDCRLLTVEERLLGLRRIDDLPGSQAPEAWFDYLQRGDARRLIRIVQHHYQDILSLAAAHVELANAVRNPADGRVDIFELARWLSEIDESQALSLLEANVDCLPDDGKRLLAELHRRNARWEQAISLWQALADSNCVIATERLAKYHEHVSKDLVAAWGYCQRLPSDSQSEHRRRRVQAKLKKSGMQEEA